MQDYQSKLGDEMSVAPSLRKGEEEIAEAMSVLKDNGVPTGGPGLEIVAKLLQKINECLPSWQRSLRVGATTALENAFFNLCQTVYDAWASKSIQNMENVTDATQVMQKMVSALTTLSSPKVLRPLCVYNSISDISFLRHIIRSF